jgi:hypothetical protein
MDYIVRQFTVQDKHSSCKTFQERPRGSHCASNTSQAQTGVNRDRLFSRLLFHGLSNRIPRPQPFSSVNPDLHAHFTPREPKSSSFAANVHWAEAMRPSVPGTLHRLWGQPSKLCDQAKRLQPHDARRRARSRSESCLAFWLHGQSDRATPA